MSRRGGRRARAGLVRKELALPAPGQRALPCPLRALCAIPALFLAPPAAVALLAAPAILALLLAGCAPVPELHTRVAGVTPAGTVAPGPVAVEIAFTAPVDAAGIADGRRVALCRGADAAAVAAAASSPAGLGPGAPVLQARVTLLPGGTRARLEPAGRLWPMAEWAVVVGEGLVDQEGRPVLDPTGRTRALRHLFQTGDLAPGDVPRVALVEALADAAAPEAGGEYAEVLDLGGRGADLAGFRLAKRTAAGALQRCTLEPLAGAAGAAPGGRALVVGGGYDGRYALPAGVAVYACGATALLGGLANDRPVALALESPGGAPISGLGWDAVAPRCAGVPVERAVPDGPDAASNLRCAAAPTPGR